MPCGAKGSRLTVGVWGPGVCSPAVSAHVRARTLWQGRWGTVPKGVCGGGRRGRGAEGGPGGERGGVVVARAFGFADCLVFGLVSYVVSYVVFGCFCLPPERFRTVQNGSGVFRPEKGMKNLRKNSRKNSRNNPCKGFSERFRTVQGYSPLKKA